MVEISGAPLRETLKDTMTKMIVMMVMMVIMVMVMVITVMMAMMVLVVMRMRMGMRMRMRMTMQIWMMLMISMKMTVAMMRLIVRSNGNVDALSGYPHHLRPRHYYHHHLYHYLVECTDYDLTSSNANTLLWKPASHSLAWMSSLGL